MYLTVHATAGLLIGQQLNNPLIGFFTGVLSHYILDFIPHGDEFIGKFSTKRKLLIGSADFIIALGLGWWLISQNYLQLTPAIIFTILGTFAPDFLWGSAMIIKMPWLESINNLHHAVQRSRPDIAPATGILLQVTLLWAGIIFLVLTH